MAIIGAVSLVIAIFAFQMSKDAELSRKIQSNLELLPKCGFESAKEENIGNILLRAQKAIDTDGVYDEAFALFSSVSGDMYGCSPTLEANAVLMLYTMLALIFGFGIIFLIRTYKELH